MGKTTNFPLLLVDDDPVVRMITRQTLSRAGYSVREAVHGRDAQLRLGEEAFSVILLDVLMPEMDGFEFCAWLRAQAGFKRIPVLMMTGLDDNESIQRAFDVGATDFIVKPVNASILIQRVRFLLRASQTLEELAKNRESLATAQRIAQLGSWRIDRITGKQDCSDEMFNILELSPERTLPFYDDYFSRVHPDDLARVTQIIQASREKGEAYDMVHRMVMPDGRTKWVSLRGQSELGPDGLPLSAYGTIQDITERQQSLETIRYLSSFDVLTGLPNRLLFEQQVNRALGRERRFGGLIAVLHIGLNRFKRINDSLGHQAGDAILVQVADRLKTASRACDYVGNTRAVQGDDNNGPSLARWSGDEFAVLLTDIRNAQDAARVTPRLLDTLGEPYTVLDQEVTTTATVGIALFPGDGDNANELLKNADSAMHHAKVTHENGGYAFYTPAINEQASLNLALEADLRRALVRDELLALYQPKVNRDGRIVGAELLIRWQHPQRGLITPDKFIPLAEESGLIIPVSEWVIETAARQVRAWLDAGHTGIGLAINLSPAHFRHPRLLDTLQDAVKRNGLSEDRLELELTEGMLMEDLDGTLRLLEQLNQAGMRLAIDDFGTGYSSLNYLTRFPIHVLKIDRSFIRNIDQDRNSLSIVRAVIAMAHSLNLQVVAEGVETQSQAELLHKESCDLIQGYLYGRPMPAEEFAQRLHDQG